MKGRLYIVATPIGNLEDITLRALRVLKEVDLVACEDTRRTKKLLHHYGISKPLVSYYEPKEEEQARRIVETLKGGGKVALVSDAGTPGISDPGYRLVRLTLEESIPVTPVPGPCAFIAALSASGLPSDRFSFYGFPPRRKKERYLFFVGLRQEKGTLIFYESPRRLLPTLKDIRDIMGDVEVVVAREVTKIHEEFIRGRVSTVMEGLAEREVKGEVIILVKGEGRAEERPLLDLIREYRERFGLSIRDVVKIVAEERGVPKGEVYKEALKLKGER